MLIVTTDNAGADVVLGMIPLARELLQRGTEVVICANSTPALNDITHTELLVLMQEIATIDDCVRASLQSQKLFLVESGNGCPLIDLNLVSEELAELAKEADLVVLEGMGRAVQSNYHAKFKCDVMKLAMIKDKQIAEHLGAQIMDCVCKFEEKQQKGGS